MMKALWWFKDHSIAGMARPGFNAAHWNDLPFAEGILHGWMGQYSSGSAPLESFRHHLKVYSPKVMPFFKLKPEEGLQRLQVFETPEGFRKSIDLLVSKTQAYKDVHVDDTHLHFSINEDRLHWEARHLKELGMRRIVSLTEEHHGKEVLADYFDLHHFSIEDLNAPTHEQALELHEVLKQSTQDKQMVAIHCLAGIGRTSTMLMAAHLAMGESFDELKSHLEKRNPSFTLKGSQADFIESFRKRLGR